MGSIPSRLTTFIFLVCLLFISGIESRLGAAQAAARPQIRVTDVERRVHALINDERANGKLHVLEYDERLATIARAQSEDMARRKFFSHINPDGLDPSARVKRAGYPCRSLGENLFQTHLYSRVHIRGNERSYDWNTGEQITTQSVRGWMKSPGHRENILRPVYRRAGVGVALATDGKVYLTQLFCSSD